MYLLAFGLTGAINGAVAPVRARSLFIEEKAESFPTVDDQFLKLNKKENCLYDLYFYIDHPVLRAMIQGVDIAKQLSGFLFIFNSKVFLYLFL